MQGTTRTRQLSTRVHQTMLNSNMEMADGLRHLIGDLQAMKSLSEKTVPVSFGGASTTTAMEEGAVTREFAAGVGTPTS